MKKKFVLFYISSFDVTFQGRRDRVVVRAADGKIENPGSSRAAEILFFF